MAEHGERRSRRRHSGKARTRRQRAAQNDETRATVEVLTAPAVVLSGFHSKKRMAKAWSVWFAQALPEWRSSWDFV